MEGEDGFRRREQAVIDELTARPATVLATGGGAVIKPENRACLKQRGIVVYLKAELDELMARTRNDKSRPLLQTDDPRSRLQALLEQREPWYLEVADIVFDTQQQNIKSAANALLRQVNALEK